MLIGVGHLVAMAESVQKQTADTYHQWKFEMRMLLMGKNLWEIVDGSETVHNLTTHGKVLKFK